MVRSEEDLDLAYLNGRINRLIIQLKNLENMYYKWKRMDDERIKKLEELTLITGENKNAN